MQSKEIKRIWSIERFQLKECTHFQSILNSNTFSDNTLWFDEYFWIKSINSKKKIYFSYFFSIRFLAKIIKLFEKNFFDHFLLLLSLCNIIHTNPRKNNIINFYSFITLKWMHDREFLLFTKSPITYSWVILPKMLIFQFDFSKKFLALMIGFFSQNMST